jgi:hypothetical protein
LFAVAGLLPLFKEVRPVEHIRGHELLVRITSLRPLWGATFAIVSNGYDAVARRKTRPSKIE